MNTTSLDAIVRRNMLETGVPIHYYLEQLTHAATCLRELHLDTLKVINAQRLPADDTGNIEIPDGFVDDIAVCLPYGQSLNRLPKQDWITPLRLHDADTGEFIPYSDLTSNNPQNVWGYPLAGTSWFWNFNFLGEPTGGFYGMPGGTGSGYQVFREQRRIQLSEGLAGTNVVLLYVGDGTRVDDATQITPNAFSTIQAFINWKKSPNRDNDNSPEGRSYYNQRMHLIARLDELDLVTIRNILHQSYSASIKT